MPSQRKTVWVVVALALHGLCGCSGHEDVVGVAAPSRERDPLVAPAAVPALSLAEIAEIESVVAQRAALYERVRTADLIELASLFGEEARTPFSRERAGLLSVFYARYAELDAPAAVAHVFDRRSPFEGRWLTAIFHTWALTDTTAAVTFAQTLSVEPRRIASRAILLANEGLVDREWQALAAKLEVEVSEQELLSTANPAESWFAALRERDPRTRTQRIAALADAWMQRDPRAAIDAIANLEDPDLDVPLQQRAIETWIAADRSAALDWVLSRPPSLQRTQVLAAALGAVAATDPDEALRLAHDLSGNERSASVEAIIRRRATIAPADAVKLFGELENAESRGRLIPSLALGLYTESPDTAFRWAETLAHGEGALARVPLVRRIALEDPRAASRHLDTIEEPALRQSVGEQLVQQWVARDPREAARWVGDQEVGERPALYQALTTHWGSRDIDSAEDFIATLPDAESRDAATVGAIAALRGDPERAEDLYRDLVSEASRQEAASHLYYQWRDRDPAKAERFRGSSTLQ